MMKKIDKIDIFRFYYYWFDVEEEMYDNIITEKNPITGLYNYLKYMKVIRNFKKNTISDVYKIVKKYKTDAKPENIITLSRELSLSNLLSGNTKKVYVAASKILWIYNRNIVIMDNNNINVLKKLGLSVENYLEYFKSWEGLFYQNKQDIIDLIECYNLNKIDLIFEEEWFQRRIFDMYLWKSYTK